MNAIGLVGEGGVLTYLVGWAIEMPDGKTQLIKKTLLNAGFILCDLTDRDLLVEGISL